MPASLADAVGFRDVSAVSPDLVLASRIADGEARAVGEAYDAHHGAVRAFARRLVADESVAEDLVHDTFVALPRAASGFRGDSALRTFLLSITVNLARHHVRAATRRRAATLRWGREPRTPPETPEHVARRIELGRALTRALDELPLDQRVAFVLCEVEERAAREVSEITGAPEATVRTRLFHAKRKLRELLDRGGYP